MENLNKVICNHCSKDKDGIQTGLCTHCGKFGLRDQQLSKKWWNSLDAKEKTKLSTKYLATEMWAILSDTQIEYIWESQGWPEVEEKTKSQYLEEKKERGEALIQAMQNVHSEGRKSKHILYTKEDNNIPEFIKDINGDVTLNVCKVCGKGESDLDQPCIVNPILLLSDDQINTDFDGIEKEHSLHMNPTKDQPMTNNSGYIIGSTNYPPKQYKKFNADLFKAYINKFSEEDKLEALYVLDNSLKISQIQEISTQFAIEMQKQPKGIVTGWWNFVKDKFPKIYR